MQCIAVFDLDGTISFKDLYLAFLIRGLLRWPARPFGASALPVHVLRFFAKSIHNDVLKRQFLHAVYHGRSRAFMDAAASSFAASAQRGMLKPAALRAIEEHRAKGDLLVLASASLDVYTLPLGRLLGFDEVLATQVEWSGDNRITGELAGPNLRGEAKIEAVRALLSRLGREGGEMVAYSDHHSDVPLLEAARQAFVIDPKPRFAAAARDRNWTVLDWKTGR